MNLEALDRTVPVEKGSLYSAGKGILCRQLSARNSSQYFKTNEPFLTLTDILCQMDCLVSGILVVELLAFFPAMVM